SIKDNHIPIYRNFFLGQTNNTTTTSSAKGRSQNNRSAHQLGKGCCNKVLWKNDKFHSLSTVTGTQSNKRNSVIKLIPISFFMIFSFFIKRALAFIAKAGFQ